MNIKNITPERLIQLISISICFILAIKINHPHVCIFFSTCTIILILMAAYKDTVYESDMYTVYIKDLLLPFSNVLKDYNPNEVIEPSYAHCYRDSIALIYENRIFSNGSVIIERDTGKRKIADGKTRYNDLPYEKENIENEVYTSVIAKSKYRQNLLYDTLVADLFIKKSIDELIEEDVILSDRSVIVITDCKYVACIIGDDKTHAVDLYIKSLEYVRDEIRVDEEDEINKHIQYVKKKKNKSAIKSKKYRLVYTTFDNFVEMKDKVIKGNYFIIITDVPIGNMLITDGVHTLQELYNLKQKEVVDYIKANIFDELFKEPPTYTPMYEINYK